MYSSANTSPDGEGVFSNIAASLAAGIAEKALAMYSAHEDAPAGPPLNPPPPLNPRIPLE